VSSRTICGTSRTRALPGSPGAPKEIRIQRLEVRGIPPLRKKTRKDGAPGFVVFESWARCCRSLELLTFGCYAEVSDFEIFCCHQQECPAFKNREGWGSQYHERPGEESKVGQPPAHLTV
jgi:hypothetical protein